MSGMPPAREMDENAAAYLRRQAEINLARVRDHEVMRRFIEHPTFISIQQQPYLRDPLILSAIAGLVIILLIFACLPKKRKAARGTPTVLLVGPMGSGKTALFTKLSQHEMPPTHTSVLPSESAISLEGKNVKLVDLAGHARLADQVSRRAVDADAAVFVVDVVSLVRNAASVAEELPPILTSLASAASSRPFNSDPTRLLILGHKADLLRSDKALETARERVKSILTREMERLKTARGAGGVGGRIQGMSKVQTRQGFWARLFGSSKAEAEAEDGEDEGLIWGGQGPWSWDDIEGVEVVWGASGLGETKPIGEEGAEGDLGEVKDFLWEL